MDFWERYGAIVVGVFLIAILMTLIFAFRFI